MFFLNFSTTDIGAVSSDAIISFLILTKNKQS